MPNTGTAPTTMSQAIRDAGSRFGRSRILAMTARSASVSRMPYSDELRNVSMAGS
jgi:hypothetical protein